MYMLKKFKNKKGYISLEIAIVMMIFISVVCGVIDMSEILRKMNGMAQTSGYVARTIGKQGGVRINEPKNFSGEYTTTNVLYENVRKILESSGFEEGEWELIINDTILSPSTSLPLIDHGKNINIALKADYNWDMLSNIIPGNLSFSKTSSKKVVSTYKVRNGTIQNDYKQD